MDAHPRSATTWARLRRARGGVAVVLALTGPVAPADAGWLCARVRVLLEHTPGADLVCEVRDVTAVELGTVDAVASVALVARRLGRRFSLTGATPELCSLIAFVGLEDALVP